MKHKTNTQKSPPLSLDRWEVARVQRVTEGSAARKRRDAVRDPSVALRLPPPLLRREDKNLELGQAVEDSFVIALPANAKCLCRVAL
jgi:hypothetical protein